MNSTRGCLWLNSSNHIRLDYAQMRQEKNQAVYSLFSSSQLAEMEEELRYAPLSFRNPMMSKLRTYRKDLAKLHREVRSTPLTATPGGRGDMKYGTYTIENEHAVSVSCPHPPFRACSTRINPIVEYTVHVTVYTTLLFFPPHPLSSI